VRGFNIIIDLTDGSDWLGEFHAANDATILTRSDSLLTANYTIGRYYTTSLRVSELIHVTTKGIIVRPSRWRDWVEQSLILRDCTIDGDVVFEKTPGKCFVDASTTVRGKFIGCEPTPASAL